MSMRLTQWVATIFAALVIATGVAAVAAAYNGHIGISAKPVDPPPTGDCLTCA
ncbi:hypothetical protein [Actinoplanes sp. NPDC051494]|uniref:hypothetical protein n=1 Tax=Actinoplanes sp. NPDC051494 TaxID=3363907 RepID=UPI0037B838C5